MQENSGALQQYLLCLKKPLFPHHVQALALGLILVSFNFMKINDQIKRFQMNILV